MSDVLGWSVAEQAQKVAQLLPDGAYVNLGIGMPSAVAAQVRPEQRIVFLCENGLIGYRELGADESADGDIIDAASRPVGLIEGAAVVAHDVSFAIARGGRLDATILGAFQVSQEGDLANWHAPGARVPAIGGAMDLATGAKAVIVMMKHLGRDGSHKILTQCDYPLTAIKQVGIIVTELAVIRVFGGRLVVDELAPGVSPDLLSERTGAPLDFSVLSVR